MLSQKQLDALAKGRKLGSSLGGKAVYEKYGSEYMAEIGRRGYESLVNRHFEGSDEAANKWLSDKGKFVTDETYRKRGWGIFRDPGSHPAELKF